MCNFFHKGGFPLGPLIYGFDSNIKESNLPTFVPVWTVEAITKVPPAFIIVITSRARRS